ncbi:bifunctional pyr operon transcriptional regulator/uracil phosphoribosyltransferase PyrR [Leptospirillum ferrooxidans]|uniref:Bifunctional protein PyrR n=1 Tax=Leptospirillum ferrooxidans (strain C2-3) TaxID=1162668 RepID=I0IMD2_LEPFC|nr:bifunctional pyr operon transcriptional regulator/uracil phosphoribosyltransferase PyrR [Leptospirillum ferrooxidans]BAM06431.1 putative uracil phosphoribosyltransferase [Leptospirillum ferrooxidans C2-3]
MSPQGGQRVLMDSGQIGRTIRRMAHEILEHNQGTKNLCLVGILQGGAILSQRIGAVIKSIEGIAPPMGTLDITLYRDDLAIRSAPPFLRESDIPFSIDDSRIVLVDDVLYTGRTVRCALDFLMDLGRPSSVQLAVLIDRGHRELPIRADIVGKSIPTSRQEKVRVLFEEDHESVTLVRMPS